MDRTSITFSYLDSMASNLGISRRLRSSRSTKFPRGIANPRTILILVTLIAEMLMEAIHIVVTLMAATLMAATPMAATPMEATLMVEAETLVDPLAPKNYGY